MTEPTAPGWYEDPQDSEQLRYYDGIVWTAHTTPLRSPTAASSTIGRAPEVQARPPEQQQPYAGRVDPAGGWSAPPVGAPGPGAILPDGGVLAEWWRRLLGRLVDWLLTSIVSGLLSVPFIGPLVDVFRTYVDDVAAGRVPDQEAMQSAMIDAAIPITAITLVVALVYEVVFLTWRAATPGKMALGTVVRPADAPGRIGLVVALRRQVIRVATTVLGVVPLVGVLGSGLAILDPAWLLWDARRQCLHDKVAGTVVVRRS